MQEQQQPDLPDRSEQPGKTRTPWHPLLTRLLNHALSNAFSVLEEVLVGKMPLRVDVLLIRRDCGQLSESGRRELSALVPLLNRFTLIEFKGPTDTLDRGDFAQLVGCAFLWHGQQSGSINCNDISLIILAPSGTGPLFEELQQLGCAANLHKPAFIGSRDFLSRFG